MGLLSDLAALYSIWDTVKDRKLSAAEKELIMHANNNKGEIVIHSTDRTGEFVSINKKAFIDDNDPAIRATALEAMEKLYRRGLIRHEGGILFCLTGTGFEIARKLK